VNLINRKKEFFESIVYDGAHGKGETVKLSGSLSGKNLLRVMLPLTKFDAIAIDEN
jgi:hypothetical protein